MLRSMFYLLFFTGCLFAIYSFNQVPQHTIPQKVIVFSDSGKVAKKYTNINDAKFYNGALHFTDTDGCAVVVYTKYHLEDDYASIKKED